LEAAPGFEPGMKDLQSSTLPLGYAAIWSGRRDSNSRLSPWQGDTLPLSYIRIIGALGRNRTTDTRIFSPLLYRLSYQGMFKIVISFVLLRQVSSFDAHVYLYTLRVSLLTFLVLLASDNFL
jgi:hypothetical protein